MKEIRQIKCVVQPSISDENNNDEDKITLDNFDSEPGYYQQVIKPMLAPGHESELLYWLKNVGLIPQIQICKNADIDDCCNKPMSWIPARSQDSYQWKCLNCSEKRTVRDNSVFGEVKCTLKNAIRIFLGWCKGKDIETMASILGAKKNVVSILYNVAAKTADCYIKSHLQDWQVGGDGVIVIIDTFPEGLANDNRPHRNYKPILCCAEVRDIPPRYWFEALDRYSKNNPDHVAQLKQKVLETIKNVVLPGSVLVTSLNSTLCSYYDLQCLKHLYPVIVSIDNLANHDNENQNILTNLETIWKHGVDICEEAQFYNAAQIQAFLTSQMWHRRFENECFEMLINQLIEY